MSVSRHPEGRGRPRLMEPAGHELEAGGPPAGPFVLCVLAFTAACHAFFSNLSKKLLTFFLTIFFFFWPRCTARRILVPCPGIELGPSAVKVPKPNHWTAKERPSVFFFQFNYFFFLNLPLGFFKKIFKWFMICFHPVKHCSRGITFKN